MEQAGFVHLRLHTDHSIVDGMVRVDELIRRCVENKMPAVALTDDSNLFKLIDFYKQAVSAGVKPLAGADLWLESEIYGEPATVAVLVQNAQGYKNLRVLISRAWQHNQRQGRAVVTQEWLEELNEGLLLLSGGAKGEIGKLLLDSREDEARTRASYFQTVFGDRFYLEVQRAGRVGDETCLHKTVALADVLHLPVVATNDVRFLEEDDFEAHEVRVCIHQSQTLDNPRRQRSYSEDQYFKSASEMHELFCDLPEALQNTVEIARRCNLTIELNKPHLPDFPVPAGMTITEFFAVEAKQGLQKRLSALALADAEPSRRRAYDERLEHELSVISKMGFAGYFLIVSDFIRWAKEQDIPVGPGRGSGAGSVVAWALEITDLDPLHYELLFERFLNPERVSMPDFDVDFCMDQRDRVINYVAQKYGRDAVGQIITFGTMAARAVIKDVARVQGKPYGLADRLSKLIPGAPGTTLGSALDTEESLRQLLEGDETDSEAAQEIWEMAVKLEGLARNVGKHAGGVVIAPGRLTDFAPLYCDEDGGNLVTQYDKNDVEAAGLVKFDFLGLRTLTIIDWALRAINGSAERQGMEPICIEAIALDDEKTFQLLQKGETTAVFQLESQGMKELIRKLKPDVFEDIIALVALYRPGPLESGMVDNFIKRKHGLEKVAYPDAQYQHDLLKPILEPTYGVILYQEQVMQIAQVLAGYTLGGADVLRRAMGKKNAQAMERERSSFREGAIRQGIDGELATRIFDLVEKFAGYGFNKSHSAAYALVAYQTAWLKAHFPPYFMAAVISAEMHNTDKVVMLVDECHAMGLQVLPPDVNVCGFRFTVNREGDIVYGLGAIKGLGEAAIESIVQARVEKPFSDLFDFCRRIDARKLNRRALESLVKGGALDSLGPTRSHDDRATLLATLPEALKRAEQEARNAEVGMHDLFADLQSSAVITEGEWQRTRHWPEDVRLDAERDTLGLFLTGHPVDRFEDDLSALVSYRLNALEPTAPRTFVTLAGLVVNLRITRTRQSNDKIAFVTLDDRKGRVEVMVLGRAFGKYANVLQKDALLVIKGSVKVDERNDGFRVQAEEITDIVTARELAVRKLCVQVSLETQGLAQDLRCELEPFRGGRCPVALEVRFGAIKAMIELGADWSVHPQDRLLEALRERFGANAVRLEYP